MMKHFISILGISLLALCSVYPASAAYKANAKDTSETSVNAEQLVKASLHANYYAGNDRITQGKMTITDSQGNVRIREFKVLRLNGEIREPAHEGDQHYFVKFSNPNDLNGVVFRVKKNIAANDDRFLYLPKIDLVRRIAAGDKRTSFVGSDVLYEDVSGRHLHEDTHTIDSESKSYHVIKSVPKDPSQVEFSAYKTWIHKASKLALKREYYDAQGKVYRKIKAKKVAQIDGIPTIMESVVTDLNTGSVTSVVCSDVSYKNQLEIDLFSERFMRNPPSQYFN
jgi:hypothetical protein